MFWLLVTGTGRCGTGFASKVLTSAGVNCTHEGIFNLNPSTDPFEQMQLRRDNPAWGWQAESSWLAVPYLDRPEMRGLTVVHLVRHPKTTIDSIVRTGILAPETRNKYWRWQRDQVPGLDPTAPPAEQAANVYLWWNWAIEQYAHLFHRVEDGGEVLLDKLGIDYEPGQVFNDNRYNARVGFAPSDIYLETLPARLRDELQTMCERYGYRWPAPKPDAPPFTRNLPRLNDPHTWTRSVHHNTFAGIPMQQSWRDIALWERIIPLVDPAAVIELGAYCGGLSVYLALQARQRNFDLFTYDLHVRPEQCNRVARMVGLPGMFRQIDAWSEAGQAEIQGVIDDAENHPLLLLCDGGDKAYEVNLYLPRLQPGDVLGVHDWGAEIAAGDMVPHLSRLEPLLHQEAQTIGSLLRFWRVT